MSVNSQTVSVKCACIHLIAAVSEKVPQCDDVVNRLAMDFNWKVRMTVGTLICQMKGVDRIAILEELIQDEERDVLMCATTAMANLII